MSLLNTPDDYKNLNDTLVFQNDADFCINEQWYSQSLKIDAQFLSRISTENIKDLLFKLQIELESRRAQNEN